MFRTRTSGLAEPGTKTGAVSVRVADFNDVDRLTEFRLDYLRTDSGPLGPEREAVFRGQLEAYFLRHLPLGDFIAVLAETGGIVVSSAFLIISERPVSPSFPTGKTGTVLNVLTLPEFRQQGIAEGVVRRLLEEAKRSGVSMVELSATKAGEPLYRKLGFREPSCTAMRISLSAEEESLSDFSAFH